MRFTPKSVFLGIVAVGLPFAVVTGWSLATPGTPPSAVAQAPGGAGGLGAAPAGRQPARTVTTPETWSPRETRQVSVIESVAPSAPPAKASPTATGTPSSAPPTSPAADPDTGSTLTLPPVPTPTSIETADPSASATDEPGPVASESAPSGGFGQLRWHRRR
ncbi:hypothetical protein [Actinoplanes sp. RD1]|uniref:hypothetical protein n=1 Tax=Actinoplanes sp. RD1 TaxID=3064538 RepID=UPI002740B6B7|nr:hypothetical protein [Actinoplanes sp. RD1]